jgi:DNA-directed RNA polymerase subunit E'/Rpb7
MKKYSIAAGALLLALFVIALGVANPASAYEGPDQEILQGTVSAVDSDGGELKIKDADGEETDLEIDSSTKISKNGKEIKLADIKVGDKVRCTIKGDSVTAIEVED